MSLLQDQSNLRVVSPPLKSSASSPETISGEDSQNDQLHRSDTSTEELTAHSSDDAPQTFVAADSAVDASSFDASSPEVSSLVSRSEESVSKQRARLRVPGALYAVVPGVLFLMMGVAARQSALPPSFALAASTRADAAGEASPLLEGNRAILAASQTLVVPARNAGQPIVWRARLRPASTVTGRAPISGQITRVWVRAGQNVNVGDRIMRIASYQQPASPTRSVVPTYNRAAEDEQVRAVRAQGDLSQRLSSAQARLKAAQTRVERAQKRVNEAMAIVQKLQSGTVYDSQQDIEPDEPAVKPREQAQERALTARLQAAQSAAEKATASAEKAEAAAAQAAREAARAEANSERKTRRAAGLRQTRERELTKNAAPVSSPTTPATAPEGAAAGVVAPPKPVEKPAAPTVTTGEIDSAESEARDAAFAASTLRAQARKLSAAADKERVRAVESTTSAKEVLRSLRLFTDANTEKPRVAKSPAKPRRAANLPSIEEAARIVKSASDESRAANREAERWKTEVDEYSRQAKSTQERIVASGQNLGSAQEEIQQRELDTVIQRNLSIVRAPSSGTVLRVSDVGDSVSISDSIVLVGKGGGLRAQFADTSGLWRNLKEGSTISAMVETGESRSSPRMHTEATASATRVPVTARIESVEEPQSTGEPAFIRAVVPSSIVIPPSIEANKSAPGNGTSGNGASDTATTPKRLRLRSGMPIELVLNSATSARVQSLPREAIVELSPNQSEGASAINKAGTVLGTPDTASTAGSKTEEPQKGLVAVLQPSEDGDYLVEWREVEVKDDGAAMLFVSGLLAGERVALPAVRLRTLAQNNGVAPVVSLR